MSKQEELFNEFRSLGSKVQQLGSIVQNEEATVTWDEIEEFDRTLATLVRDVQSMRMRVILHLKDSGRIK